MKFLYVDEAGISAHEPVTVVLGVLIDADRHWRQAEARLRKVLDDQVPAKTRPGFVFHAKKVFAGCRDMDNWKLEDRIALIKEVVRIPFELQLPIPFGWVHRTVNVDSSVKGFIKEMLQHGLAFANCIAKADQDLRRHALPGEIATVIAEDNPQMRKFLRHLSEMLRQNPTINREGYLRVIVDGVARSVVVPPYPVRVSRIVDCIHFVEKNSAPLLQIADGCAFVLRRFLSKQSRGEELCSAMCGGQKLDVSNWNFSNQAGIIHFAELPFPPRPGRVVVSWRRVRGTEAG